MGGLGGVPTPAAYLNIITTTPVPCASQNGQSSLHEASLKGHTGAIVALIEGKASVDLQDEVMPRRVCVDVRVVGVRRG